MVAAPPSAAAGPVPFRPVSNADRRQLRLAFREVRHIAIGAKGIVTQPAGPVRATPHHLGDKMIFESHAAAGRGGLAALVLLAAVAWASPAQAACQAKSWQVNPKNQNNVHEFDAAAGYSPTLVTLSLSRALSDGTVVVWTQTGGPSVTLNGSNTATPTFLTPLVPDVGATLTFRATITCPGGDSASDTGTVSILNVNRPPLAVAQASPPVAFEGDAVTLNGTASSDPDGDSLRYAWTRTAGPAVTLSGANTATATFTAPASASPDGYTAQFQLQVFDRPSGGLTSTTSVVVNVTPNLPPLAALSCPSQVPEGGPVLLDGSGSADPNGEALTYAWTQLQGTPAIAVGDQTGSTVAFTAPGLTLGQDGFVEFELRVTDPRGLWDLATCMFEIRDVTPPVVTVTPPAATEALSPAGASVSFSANVSAQDNVDGDLTPFVACVPPSGALFGLGDTTVDCEVDDSIGNIGRARFAVRVQDTIAPVIHAHGDFAVEATGAYGAVVSYDAPGTDDAVDVALVATCAPASGSTFALGPHTVTCNATDASGNVAIPTTFAVTVHDTTGPTIDAHDDLDPVEATGPLGAVVTYDAPATHDAVDGDGVARCAPASGATFAIGRNTITCSARDLAGNDADETTFTVTVQDTTPPTIDVHPNLAPVEATGPDGAPVDYTAPATHDVVDGNGTATCTPASGATFALGGTTVTCTARDAAGNAAAPTTFSVTVQDTTPPLIATHDDLVVEATGADGALVTYTAPSTSDAVDGPDVAACLPASGTTLALGTHTVNCRATDAHGNVATPTSFIVRVVDTTAPAIAPHGNIGPVEATSAAGAVVSYTPPATSDAVDGLGAATCAPPPNATFPLGHSYVACSARDRAGNAATPTGFSVDVVDTTAPLIAPHADVTAEATGPTGAVVSFASPATSDAVDGTGAASCLPASGSAFVLGATTVTCRATDAHGNIATPTSFLVRVVDTTAPAIASHPDITVNATGNSSAEVAYALPGASDLVDGSVAVSCTPPSGSTFVVGRTLVTCSATDVAGNRATSSFAVDVAYAFTGFQQPIDTAAINTVKAGSAIPVKFGLGGYQGMQVFVAGSPASAAMACDASAPTDEVEVTVAAGSSSLQYDAGTDRYHYVWKTEKGWLGCRQLRMTLRDGSVRTAVFKFR